MSRDGPRALYWFGLLWRVTLEGVRCIPVMVKNEAKTRICAKTLKGLSDKLGKAVTGL